MYNQYQTIQYILYSEKTVNSLLEKFYVLTTTQSVCYSEYHYLTTSWLACIQVSTLVNG